MRRALVGLLIVPAVLLTSAPGLQAQSGGGHHVVPYAQQCGLPGNPCIPKVSLRLRGYPASPLAPESTYTYTAAITNVGYVSGIFWYGCSSTNPQLRCNAWDGSTFTLDVGQEIDFPITVHAMGLGSGHETVQAWASINGDIAVDTKSAATPTWSVVGKSIFTILDPLPGQGSLAGDTLQAVAFHSSGIDSASIKNWFDGTLVSSGVKSVAVPNGRSVSFAPNLTTGPHTWLLYGCSVSGRCDSLSTGAPVAAAINWNLDDSLPPFVGSTGMGGVGPLAIPPDSLRGCPMQSNGIELRITEPATTVTGQGNPTAFVAAYITTPNSLRISLVHVQNQDPAQTCDNPSAYSFVGPSGFNYGWWLTDYYPGFFAQWPYEPGGYSVLERRSARIEEFVWADVPQEGFDLRDHGPNASGTDHWFLEVPEVAAPGRLFARLGAAVTPPQQEHGLGALMTGRAMLPDPGAVDTMSTSITLNGVQIVQHDAAVYSGVVKVSGWKGGSTWTIVGSEPIVNTVGNGVQGGWNELIASVATTDGKRSYMRSRFVLGPPEIAPDHATVAALRSFDHASTSDCPAFGALQCGSLFLTEAIPGFVSRDRDRSLALVYRSGSQRVPTLFPIRYYVDRYHRKPDSLRVQATVDGTLQPAIYRYAGDSGVPAGINTPIMEAGVSADRVVGVEIPAALSGDIALRSVVARISSYYTGSGVIIDSAMSTVVQAFNTTATSSRFGPGWSLSALQRLHHGLMWGTDSAKVLVTADGSFEVFRRTGSGPWRAPAGSTARLRFRAAADSGANWILSLDDGTRMGFYNDSSVQTGRLAWTEDLVGNRTRYSWGTNGATGADSLLKIIDPTGAYFRLTYGAGLNGAFVSAVWVRAAGASDSTQVDGLVYDTSNRLSVVRRYRTATAYDSTRYVYHGPNPAGALIDSIVDPRSTSTNNISELVTWDTLSWTPSQLQTPVWTGTTRYSTWFRDVWRRATPRANYGRLSTQPQERMITPDQLRGTFIDFHGPVDFRVDRFNGTAYVRRPPPDTLWAVPGCTMFCFSTASMDQIRDIERDTVTGQVTKVVVNRLVGPGVADSVMYRYDPVTYRATSVIKPVAGFDSGQTTTLDTLTFRYDSVQIEKVHYGTGTVAADSARCYRLLVSKGVHNDSTVVSYGTTTGVGKCLPVSVTEPGNLTSTMTYGSLTVNDRQTSRPIRVTDAAGVTDTAWIAGITWNTDSSGAGGIRSRAFYGALGRPDSTRTGSGTSKTGSQFVYDSRGRVTYSRTGWGTSAPVSATFFGPSGLVDSLQVYPTGSQLNVPLSGARIETTRYYYDRFGFLDSTLTPGPRTVTSDTLARKQSYRRLPNGEAFYTFPGNGSWITRLTNAQGGVISQGLSSSTPSAVSGDGERYMAPYTFPNGYQSLDGTWNHLGTLMSYGYDVNNRPIWNIAYDVFTHDTTMRVSRTFDAQGKLTGETRYFSGKLVASRGISYNRRGQRLAVSDTVFTLSGPAVTGEVGGKQLFTYDNLTGRLMTVEARVSGNGASNQPYAKLTLTYNNSTGQLSQRSLQTYDNDLGSWSTRAVVLNRYGYSGATGRMVGDTTFVNGTVRALFAAADGNYSSSGDLLTPSVMHPTDGGIAHSESYVYDTSGTRRLLGSSTWAGTSAFWYDAFGNRAASAAGAPCMGQFPPTDTVTFAPDNRIKQRLWGACTTTFVSDQAGNRLAEIDADSGTVNPQRYQRMSYTALGQLYASGTNTSDPGHYDFNWHWYDADGMRVKTMVDGDNPTWFATFDLATKPVTYYIYDGSELALTLVGQNGSFSVEKRFVSLGVDAAMAGRFPTPSNGVRTLALLSDPSGTTTGAVLPSGLNEPSGVYTRDPFGKSTGAAAGFGTGFAGGSTPNASGGFTYFRNRWYDPNTGRFLTQDPIGMNGGVNLYAYAGNNPVMFSDPFGLKACCFEFVPAYGEAGAGIGAGIGTFVEPGAGTAIGTGIGEDVGLIVGLAGGVLAMARDRARNIQLAESQLAVANRHLTQIDNLRPDDDDPDGKRRDWSKHAAKALRNAQKYVDDLAGKTKEIYQQKINDAWQHLGETHQGPPQ